MPDERAGTMGPRVCGPNHLASLPAARSHEASDVLRSRPFDIINPPMILDSLQRPLANLRLSVTDRCNLRCQYCMPEQDYVWLPRQDILHFEEIDGLIDVFLDLGVRKVRLTGG